MAAAHRLVTVPLATTLIAATVAAAQVAPERQAELLHLLRQDCAACHGMTLQGGLGPPLTPRALEGKPAIMLRTTILQGRPGTAMPPWQPFLTEAEADWLVARLKAGIGGGE